MPVLEPDRSAVPASAARLGQPVEPGAAGGCDLPGEGLAIGYRTAGMNPAASDEVIALRELSQDVRSDLS
jgi:hypothetical protein